MLLQRLSSFPHYFPFVAIGIMPYLLKRRLTANAQNDTITIMQCIGVRNGTEAGPLRHPLQVQCDIFSYAKGRDSAHSISLRDAPRFVVMNCLKCGNELTPDGHCNCGWNIFESKLYAVSQLSDSQTSLLTEMYLKSYKNKKCEPENGSPLQKKKFCMWGPERPTYTNAHPATFAVFNSITDNAAVGDERNFVRIAEKNVGATYCSNLVIAPEKQYEVFIYLHNDASSTFNDKAHNYVGIAKDTRLSCAFPISLSKGQEGLVHSKITSSSTNPPAVWAGAYITASVDMTLHYVTGSAKIYTAWAKEGRVLSINLFSEEGTFLGMRELNGVYPGCDEFSGVVVYTIQTHTRSGA